MSDKVTVRWSKREKDLLFTGSADGQRLLFYHLSAHQYNFISQEWEDSFIKDLVEKGYDLSTLKFSIEKKDV
jgi:hypothetical protein